ncbi:hypothetical protein BD770DRAFT_465643 [Pilaira anomala]|nr:hypothetical protein BD770DRAFT_465643 [Pilaira anomala]
MISSSPSLPVVVSDSDDEMNQQYQQDDITEARSGNESMESVSQSRDSGDSTDYAVDDYIEYDGGSNDADIIEDKVDIVADNSNEDDDEIDISLEEEMEVVNKREEEQEKQQFILDQEREKLLQEKRNLLEQEEQQQFEKERQDQIVKQKELEKKEKQKIEDSLKHLWEETSYSAASLPRIAMESKQQVPVIDPLPGKVPSWPFTFTKKVPGSMITDPPEADEELQDLIKEVSFNRNKRVIFRPTIPSRKRGKVDSNS